MTFNWRNRTLWTGDNLDVMRGMNSGSVDLIYLDPPFNSNADYSAPIGSEGDGAEYERRWKRSIATGGSSGRTVEDLTSNAICTSNPALRFGT